MAFTIKLVNGLSKSLGLNQSVFLKKNGQQFWKKTSNTHNFMHNFQPHCQLIKNFKTNTQDPTMVSTLKKMCYHTALRRMKKLFKTNKYSAMYDSSKLLIFHLLYLMMYAFKLCWPSDTHSVCYCNHSTIP